MTNNIDRAAELIYDALSGQYGDFGLPTAFVAQALADAGLLMPDLPEPGRFPDGSLEWYTIDGCVNLEPGEPLIVSHDERDSEIATPELDPDPGSIIITKPEYATALACCILAAADHMEKNA